MKEILLVSILFTINLATCSQSAAPPNPPSTLSAPVPTPKPERTPMKLECPKLSFKFEIAGNELYSEKVRHIWLYLEPSAFNTNNLRDLFACVSNANPEPVHLTVELNTDWSRLPDPTSTQPGTGCGGCLEDPHRYDFLQATYIRQAPREYFKYSPVPYVKDWDFIEVNMKR